MRVALLLALVACGAWGQDGKALFFDKRLSRDGSVSCGTCHDPKHAFADGEVLSAGVDGRRGTRHTPTVLGRGAGRLQFWDGRSASLEEQVLEPIRNPNEMAMTVEEALARVEKDYPGLDARGLARALASYVGSIRSEGSAFDRFMRGDGAALNALEREGLRLFRDKARCYICHSGDQFTDEQFHNTGVAWSGAVLRDEGRAGVTGKRYHKGAFKTPTLREVALTAPYMHDGSIGTLEEVVEFYDRGGNRNPWLDENVEKLGLTVEEKRALVAFLRALSGTVRDGGD